MNFEQNRRNAKISTKHALRKCKENAEKGGFLTFK